MTQIKVGDRVRHRYLKDTGIGVVQELRDHGFVEVKYDSRYNTCVDPVGDLEILPPLKDLINHPPHYTGHPSGIECIQITEHMNFCRGNAVKYIWRAGEKGNEIEDLKKARWYIDREIARLTKNSD